MIQPLQAVSAVKHPEQLTHQAQKLVAQTFYGTLMKQMHDSPFKSQLMDGGRGGQAFQPLMDQHLIDRMARSSGNKAGKLVRSVVKRLERIDSSKNRIPGVAGPADTSKKESGSPSEGSLRRQPESAPRSLRQKSIAPNPLQDVRFHVAPGLRA